MGQGLGVQVSAYAHAIPAAATRYFYNCTTTEVAKPTRKQLDAVDPVARISAYLKTHVLTQADPRELAKRLVGDNSLNWRDRVGLPHRGAL